MIERDDILGLLHGVAHPESGNDIVTLGMIENLTVSSDKIQFTLAFTRAKDPFALQIKKRCEEMISARYVDYSGKITIFIKEVLSKATAQNQSHKSTDKGSPTNPAGSVIAISSAKGGVGKSTVTANIAVVLAQKGYKVGVLDADIYGPSQPIMFGVDGFQPIGEKVDGRDMIIPAESMGVKIMSIGFFINSSDALVWRGPMATNALKQMIHQTLWGELDFLLIDLPPGTGDVHLSLISELSITAAVIVSTPQSVALADVIRGISMFKSKGVEVPVLGLVENMAWFTPAELPNNKYYIFGRDGVKRLAEDQNIPLLGEIPLIQSVAESADAGTPISASESLEATYYHKLAQNIVAQLQLLKH